MRLLVACACLPACLIAPTGNYAFSFPVHFITKEFQSNPPSHVSPDKFSDGCICVLGVLALDQRAGSTDDWVADRLFGVSWNKAPAAERGPNGRECLISQRGRRTLWCLWILGGAVKLLAPDHGQKYGIREPTTPTPPYKKGSRIYLQRKLRCINNISLRFIKRFHSLA